MLEAVGSFYFFLESEHLHCIAHFIMLPLVLVELLGATQKAESEVLHPLAKMWNMIAGNYQA